MLKLSYQLGQDEVTGDFVINLWAGNKVIETHISKHYNGILGRASFYRDAGIQERTRAIHGFPLNVPSNL